MKSLIGDGKYTVSSNNGEFYIFKQLLTILVNFAAVVRAFPV